MPRPFSADRLPVVEDDAVPRLDDGLRHIMSAGLNRSNAKHYRSVTTGFRQFEGRSPFTVGEAGWEAVADSALDGSLAPSATGLAQ